MIKIFLATVVARLVAKIYLDSASANPKVNPAAKNCPQMQAKNYSAKLAVAENY